MHNQIQETALENMQMYARGFPGEILIVAVEFREISCFLQILNLLTPDFEKKEEEKLVQNTTTLLSHDGGAGQSAHDNH